MTEYSKQKRGHLLEKLERKWTDYLTPRIPLWLDSKRLTLATLLWSVLVIFFGYLAKDNVQWLWGISLVIILEYLTDSLDGNVGRYRQEGWIKWGLYMDKMLDWIFVVALLVGYSFILPGNQVHKLMYIAGVYGALMLHTTLVYMSTGEYKVSFFGVSPTEARICIIFFNSLLIVFGRIYIVTALPYILGGAVVAVFIVMHQTQKKLSDMDEVNKK